MMHTPQRHIGSQRRIGILCTRDSLCIRGSHRIDDRQVARDC
jgi:hypothetical protein